MSSRALVILYESLSQFLILTQLASFLNWRLEPFENIWKPSGCPKTSQATHILLFQPPSFCVEISYENLQWHVPSPCEVPTRLGDGPRGPWGAWGPWAGMMLFTASSWSQLDIHKKHTFKNKNQVSQNVADVSWTSFFANSFYLGSLEKNSSASCLISPWVDRMGI